MSEHPHHHFLRREITAAALMYAETGDADYLAQLEDAAASYRFAKTLIITRHAVERFQERSGCESEAQARQTITKMLLKGEELVLKEKWIAMQLIAHNFNNARYYKFNDWLLVLCGRTIVTCHQATAKRWKRATTGLSAQQQAYLETLEAK